MFRFFVSAAAANVSLLGYTYNWRKNHVDNIYNNMNKDLQEEIYNNCPEQKFLSHRDGISTLEAKILSSYPPLHEQDKPLKSFKR